MGQTCWQPHSLHATCSTDAATSSRMHEHGRLALMQETARSFCPAPPELNGTVSSSRGEPALKSQHLHSCIQRQAVRRQHRGVQLQGSYRLLAVESIYIEAAVACTGVTEQQCG